jgi:hypothetical protein
VNKRIVLKHPSGLYQILGEIDAQPDEWMPVEAGVVIDGKPTALCLIAAHRTYYLYVPLMRPTTKTFDPRQQ